MQKVLFVMNRPEGQSKMPFCQYWSTDGYIALQAMPGVDRVVMNFVFDNTQRNPRQRLHENFELMAEVWFTQWSPQEVAAIIGELLAQGRVGHVLTLVAEERRFRETSDPYVYVAVPGQLRRTVFMRKKAGLSQAEEAEFAHEWGVVHPRFVDAIPNVARYAQNWVSDESCAGECAGAPHGVDGIVELRYDSLDEMENRPKSGGQQHLENYLESSSTYLAQEWVPSSI